MKAPWPARVRRPGLPALRAGMMRHADPAGARHAPREDSPIAYGGGVRTETLFDPPRPAGRVAFTVAGEPQPQGSKSPFPIYKGGPCGTCKRRELATINLTEAVKGLRPWRREVARAAAAAMGGQPPLAGPLLVHATFTMRKPATAPRRRRTWPKARPDVDKLLRAVLDGMTLGGTYTDDGQVVVALAAKCYPGEPSSGLPWERPLDAPGVHITIERLAWLPGETP